MKKLTIVLSLMLVSFLGFGQTDSELVDETIKKSTIKGHIYFLASDELAGRETGTYGSQVAARYMATTFQRYGVSPVPGATEGYFQQIPLVKVIPPDAYSVSIAGQSIDDTDIIRWYGSDVAIDQEIVFMSYGSVDAVENSALENKVVVIIAGEEDGKEDYRSLMKAGNPIVEKVRESGASGIIELVPHKLSTWGMLSNYTANPSIQNEANVKTDSFFRIWVKDTKEKIQKSLMKKMVQNAQLTIAPQMTLPLPAQNVVGMVEGTDPELKDEFVIYSAHYDHLGVGKPDASGDSIYNGARDNAVGVVTVMSAAESIAKNPTKRSALFILFDAEEKGLIGSKYYVENPLISLDQMVYCFNSDNGGYNTTELATIVGLGRTTAEKHIKTAAEEFGLKAIDDPAGEQGLFDRSDNVNFARKGIPAPTFSLGFTAFDQEIMKYYHQQRDNSESIDYDYMEKFFKAYVLSARLIANDEETPFWTEGDKYYEAGVELYDK